MSDYRFGLDDYGLNIYPREAIDDGSIEFDKVESVEIDGYEFVSVNRSNPWNKLFTVFKRKLEILRLKKLERTKYKEMINVGCFAANTGDINAYRKSLELENELDEIRTHIAELKGTTG